jgi:putative SOS response-associated peptidase YedK
MCNAYNLRHREAVILGLPQAMQLELTDLPEFPPWHRTGIRKRGLLLRPWGSGPLAWSPARWSLIPPGSREPRAYPLNNARSDKLASWPWRGVQRVPGAKVTPASQIMSVKAPYRAGL